MCQPKFQGGKRCANGSYHATTALIKLVQLHTGDDPVKIRQTFTALSEQGKDLAPPTAEETKAWLEAMRLSLKLDNTLNRKDKEMIIKKLEASTKDGTPDPGTFHAWKQLGAIATTGILIGSLALTGCSTTPGVNNNGHPAELSISEPAKSGKELSDARGSWPQSTIPASHAIFKAEYAVPLNPSSTMTEADLLSAREWAIKFAATEGVDSIAMDSVDGWEKWVKTEAPKYIDPAYLKELTSPPKTKDVKYVGPGPGGNTVDRSMIIMNNQSNGFTNALVRGEARIAKIGFESPVSANALKSVENGVKIHGRLAVKYKVEDDYMISYHRSKGAHEDIIKSMTELYDGKPDIQSITFDFTYNLLKQKDGSWKIAGYDNQY